MKALRRLTTLDFQLINEALQQAVENLEDFQWGPWWLRCSEFHFNRGIFQAGDEFGWHTHKELQIEIPLRGKFSFWFRQGKRISLEPRRVLVIPPDLEHRWRSDAPGIMIGLRLSVIPRANSLDISICNGLKPDALSPEGIGLILDGFMAEFYISSRHDQFAAKRRMSWMYLVITRILGALSPSIADGHSGESAAEPATQRNERLVGKIMRYVDANISGNLAMEKIESLSRLSARQIHRVFMEVTGRSCHSYIMDHRLEIARSKLQAAQPLTIKEIAHASGFASAAHFSSKFKTKFGVTPNEYR